jgi:single-strand DNA-binding protein
METVKNKVQLTGFLGRDPEIKATATGKQMARFSLGTQDNYTKKGSEVNNVQWHSLVAWGKIAARVESDLKKGISVTIEGKLMQRNYTDTAGKKHYITEVLVYDLVLLNNK